MKNGVIMKNLFLLLLCSLIIVSCSSDSSNEPAKEEIKITASTTMPNCMVPIAAGNTYIYKDISGNYIYDTLHAINVNIYFENENDQTYRSDVSCYHNDEFISRIFQDWDICGYNAENELSMSCWSGDPNDLIDEETIRTAMFYDDSLEVGTPVGDFIYRGKEHLTIDGKVYVNTYVYDNYSNVVIPDTKRHKIFLYKGVGLLKSVTVKKNTDEIVETLTLQGCKLK